MKRISMDLRLRVIGASEAGHKTKAVADLFKVSSSWVRRLKQRLREDGTLEARPCGGDQRSSFDAPGLEQLRQVVQRQPDATLGELRETALRELGVGCGVSSIGRALEKLGLSFKKKSLRPSEQQRPDVQARREAWAYQARTLDVHRLIFLDESSAKTNMTRLRGRAPLNQRLVADAPHGHWHTTTMLSAIRSTGVIESASLVFEGATNGMIFRDYVETCLAPALRSGDIVVMDNLAAHKVVGVAEAITAVGAELWYLPPYSPDLNPIEKLWSKVKSWLRKLEARTADALVQAIGLALRDVDSDECHAFFKSCGYAMYGRRVL